MKINDPRLKCITKSNSNDMFSFVEFLWHRFTVSKALKSLRNPHNPVFLQHFSVAWKKCNLRTSSILCRTKSLLYFSFKKRVKLCFYLALLHICFTTDVRHHLSAFIGIRFLLLEAKKYWDGVYRKYLPYLNW